MPVDHAHTHALHSNHTPEDDPASQHVVPQHQPEVIEGVLKVKVAIGLQWKRTDEAHGDMEHKSHKSHTESSMGEAHPSNLGSAQCWAW